MPGAPQPLEIPRELLEEVYQEARQSFPAECCGWLSGKKDSQVVSAVRRCENVQESNPLTIAADRGAERAYNFSVSDIYELDQSLEGDNPAQVIYHSHPNGQAYFSPTDIQVASPWGDGPAYPVQQLVVGVTEQRVVEAALFAWSDEANEFVEIARYPGAEI
ncbi:MAG: Mov34/MPN/PAD-1 family protein [Dehalococcoidia bacterium]